LSLPRRSRQAKAGHPFLGAPNLSFPERFRLGIEHHGRLGREDVPGALQGLALQLSGSPASVADVHPEATRIGPGADLRLECHLRGNHLDVVEDAAAVCQRRGRAQQRQHAIGRDGSAHEHMGGLFLRSLQVREQPRQRHFAPAVQDQPHRVFRAVLGQQDDRLGEVGIGQATGGHQQLAGRQFLHGA
jgi:hypothetical protein